MPASTQYVISGTSMTLRPIDQTWEYAMLGENWDGTRSYARKKSVLLSFGDCPYSLFAEWQAKCSASQTSIDMPSSSGIAFVEYRNVALDMESRPKQIGVTVSGGWTIRVSDVISNVP